MSASDLSRLSAVVGLCVPFAIAAAGPEWTEVGDAGDSTGSAQTPLGNGDLSKINGALTGGAGPGIGDFQDIYQVFIKDPKNFSASTQTSLGGIANFDINLYLFDELGRGVVGNQQAGGDPNAATLLPDPTDGTNVTIVAGFYFIAVSGSFSQPLGGTGAAPIFNFLTPDEISGPDGPGGAFPLNGWSDNGAIGQYEIALRGVSFVPGPGSLTLLASSGLLLARRRR